MNTPSSPSVAPAVPHGDACYEVPGRRTRVRGGSVAGPQRSGQLRLEVALRCSAFTLAALAVIGSGFGQQFEAVRLPAPDYGEPFGIFGRSVAVGPNWAAAADDGNSIVVLYARTPTGWRQAQRLEQEVLGRFGRSMSFNGNSLVVGDPWWDFSGERKGKVFVYERVGDQWTVDQVLQPPGLRWNDRFGWNVALDGEVLVIGAPGVDTPGEEGGAVFIYERIGSAPWGLVSVFRSNDLSGEVQPTALLGRAVGVSGETVVAGADSVGDLEGEVWVFEREGTVWRNSARLVDPASGPADHLGKSVAISGDTIVAGEGGQDAIGFKQGTALVFERGAGGNWHLVQEIEASDGFGGQSSADGFGDAVAMEGDTIVVLSPAAHGAVGPSGGALYRFHRTAAGTWPQHETGIMVPSNSIDDLNGGIDLRDGVIFAGSLSYPRSAYVFEIESGYSFCIPAPNSTGEPAHLAAVLFLGGDGILSVHDAPSSTPGAFLASPTVGAVTFRPSSLCLGPGLWRLDPIAPTGGAGMAMHELDMSTSGGLVSGVTFYFQYWFEDPSAAVGTFNFSNAVAVILP